MSSTTTRVAARLVIAPLALTVMVTGQAATPASAAPAHTTANLSPSITVDVPRDVTDMKLEAAAARTRLAARLERAEARRAREEARQAREAAAIGQRIVAAAAAQAGKPYVYGATGPSAFDCSGLTGWAYAQVGIALPRTSGAQRAVMTVVSDPQPGDLVYMPGHIGIYAGNGQMWHAPHTGDVVRLTTIWTSVTYGRVR